jgi:hypothetical protein
MAMVETTPFIDIPKHTQAIIVVFEVLALSIGRVNLVLLALIG